MYKPGKYVVAVSGGVDSMALLHVLRQVPDIELVVAHFDHGIREDSAEDRELVQQVAGQYGLAFYYEEGHMGPQASEAVARDARYAFLRKVREEQGALAIFTAHHQDDVLETVIINLSRGTGRRGLSSLRSTEEIIRPLLGMTKQMVVGYAQQHGLRWREDSTNTDETYLRNYIRRQIMPRITTSQRQQLYAYSLQAARLNAEIETLITPYISGRELPRQWFIMLPHIVALEVMASWLRAHGIAFDRRLVDRLVIFAKTAFPGKQASIDAAHRLETGKQYIILLAKHL